jgi:hypothetical protein
MKQIGANVIADNSITSTKPAESFMHRVTYLDNSVGHSVGWNPNGLGAGFAIIDPFAIGPAFDQTFVTVTVTGPEGSNIVAFCDAATGSFGSFHVRCESAPPEGSELHYVMTVLPEHV